MRLSALAQSSSHWTKARSKSWSLTLLKTRALPMPTGSGRRIPMEFATRSFMAASKNLRSNSGLWTGTLHLRSMCRMLSRSVAEMLPRTCDSTVMYAMSQATASPCISSCWVPSASISRHCPTAWPKSTSRSRESSQRFGASSSSMVSIDRRSTRAGASSAPSRAWNLELTSCGPCSSSSLKSSADFMMAIFAISPRLLEMSRLPCVLKKSQSSSAATGGT
mmetsp:Transcript_70297/g.198406  ORF Transcript_70297/g.198406 Transcript_70297/m.198406 type:complete len:221 (+) Transcript_70297:1955-2617(+)